MRLYPPLPDGEPSARNKVCKKWEMRVLDRKFALQRCFSENWCLTNIHYLLGEGRITEGERKKLVKSGLR